MPKEIDVKYVTYEFEDGSTYRFDRQEYYSTSDAELLQIAMEKRGKVIGNLAEKNHKK